MLPSQCHPTRQRRGFSLIEIMFVIFGIALLLSVAFPVFYRARSNARGKSCQSNLTKIDLAKSQWAMDTNAPTTDTPTTADLFGPGKYLRVTPECPSSGVYNLGNLNTSPTCSIGDNMTPGDDVDDHIFK